MRKPWLWLLAAAAAAQQETKPVSDAEALVSLTGLFRRAPAKAAALHARRRQARGVVLRLGPRRGGPRAAGAALAARQLRV